MVRALLIAVALCGLLPASAAARVVRSESVLPPGQSGFVSVPGLASGTGSPHLYDQQNLFITFGRKSAAFDQPGSVESPRPGVRIVRGPYGVPNVHGASDGDAWFGAGYAMAQDRLFQLELFRRAAEGRLAEILGPDYLDDDLIARRDYYTPEELDAMLARVPAPLRARFDAVRDGINAWIAHVQGSPGDLPGEFAATGAPVAPWNVRDSAAIGVLLARTVPSGDGNELGNLASLRAIGPSSFNAVLPLRVPGQLTTIPEREGRFPEGRPLTARQERRGFARTRRFAARLALPPEATMTPTAAVASASAGGRPHPGVGMLGHVGGSSMFAVRKPRGRGAILFNGPQLGFSVPELFVELEVHAPGLDVRGVTAAGVPVIGIGHNADVAWGLTSGLSDEDDLYADQLVPGQSERYLFRGAEQTMNCRDETFRFRTPPSSVLSLLKLKPQPPQTGQRSERICRTQHGPVQARAGGTAYARRYAIWGRELETLEGLAQVNTARNVGEVDRAVQKVTWNENLMAADSQGNIGYWHPGLLPVRPKGFDERLPYPGTGQAEWRGLLDRRKDPHVINPRQGWLANWNNVPSAAWTSGDAPAPERLGGAFHRVGWLMRLVRNLAARPSFDAARSAIGAEGTVAQQRPLASARLRRAATGATGDAATVLRTILAWDGSYARQDAAGTVDPGVATWETFKDAAERIALARRGGAGAAPLAAENGMSHMFDASNGENLGLRLLTPSEYRQAAAAAFATLSQRFGSPDPGRWREPRRFYEVSAQGAGSAPPLPFFDRGTWEQVVETGP